MGITHMESLKTMCPPGFVGSRNSQDTAIYKLHLHLQLHIHPQISAQILQKQDEYKTL